MGNDFYIKGEQAYDEAINYLSDNADVIDKKTGRKYILAGDFNYYYRNHTLLALANSKSKTIELGNEVGEEIKNSIEHIIKTTREM
jgi:hypothetical protein